MLMENWYGQNVRAPGLDQLAVTIESGLLMRAHRCALCLSLRLAKQFGR